MDLYTDKVLDQRNDLFMYLTKKEALVMIKELSTALLLKISCSFPFYCRMYKDDKFETKHIHFFVRDSLDMEVK